MKTLVAGLVFVIASLAQPPSHAQLERQLKFWQKRLGLEDWEICLQVVRQSALDKNTWGNAEWDWDRKFAVINVLDPQDYNLKGNELRRDMECTIVHELVHIQVAPLEAKDSEVREEVVNHIMTALINRPCPN